MGSQNHDRLADLPAELLVHVLSYLTNHAIKNLRLTNKYFYNTARLRLTRVFLSANPRNVNVFRAVADHDTFRKEIIEIVCDDTPLPDSVADMQGYGESPDAWIDENERDCGEDVEGIPTWFLRARRLNVEELGRRKGGDVDRPDHVSRSQEVAAQLSAQESWAYYQDLLQQQEEVLNTGADIDALKYGLQRFPSLRRIVITPAAHGWLYMPLYQTPMIRAFPYGFNYPNPPGWPYREAGDPPALEGFWDDADERNKWRGFCVVMQQLAESQHQISELLVDAHYMNTGLNCRIFDEPCPEYNSLVTLLRSNGFRRLDLDLMVGGQAREGWPSLRRGYIHRALAEATGLEHVSLRANMDPDFSDAWLSPAQLNDRHVPLRSIFPTDKWSRLQHFGILGFLVKKDDVISLLAALSVTLRSVELSFLNFLRTDGHYKALLGDMRDKLDWHDRAESARPRVVIGVKLSNPVAGRAIWLEKEAYDFLFHSGDNPFGQGGCGPNQVAFGMGTVRDAFEPAYERPYVDFDTYMRLGYTEKRPWYVP